MSFVPINQVCEFDGHTYNTSSAITDADATPTYEVFQEGNATAIATGNMTKRSTGTYYFAITASVANGFTAGKMHQAKMLATVGGAAGKQVLARFICTIATSVTGVPVAGVEYWRSAQPNALTSGRVEVLVGAVTAGVIAAASFASNALDAVWSTATRVLTAATNLTTALATPTNITAGTITTVTNLTNAPTAGDLTATMKTSVATAIWDEATSGHTSAGTYGDKFGAHVKGVLKVIVGSSSTTTSVILNSSTGIDGAAPSSTDDFYNGAALIFTSGVLAGQRTSISDYTGSTKTLTVVALTSAPASGVTALIV